MATSTDAPRWAGAIELYEVYLPSKALMASNTAIWVMAKPRVVRSGPPFWAGAWPGVEARLWVSSISSCHLSRAALAERWLRSATGDELSALAVAGTAEAMAPSAATDARSAMDLFIERNSC